MNKTLIEHRKELSENLYAYTYDVYNTDRLIETLIPHLKKAGFSKVTFKKHNEILKEMIHLIFIAQEERPIFHIEGTQLPLAWNAPKDWDKNYIKYQWGHLLSQNQNPTKAHHIENLALYSARCNQHIQSSMDIQELMIYGGILAQRISSIMLNRRRLFVNENWKKYIEELSK